MSMIKQNWIAGFICICTCLFLICQIFMFFFLQKEHLDIKRDSFIWNKTIKKNTTILNFPVIEASQPAKYNWLSRDGIVMLEGVWEIRYMSHIDSDALLLQISNYLEEKGILLNKVEEPTCQWSDFKDTENTTRYAGISEKNQECLNLMIHSYSDLTLVVCSVLL